MLAYKELKRLKSEPQTQALWKSPVFDSPSSVFPHNSENMTTQGQRNQLLSTVVQGHQLGLWATQRLHLKSSELHSTYQCSQLLPCILPRNGNDHAPTQALISLALAQPPHVFNPQWKPGCGTAGFLRCHPLSPVTTAGISSQRTRRLQFRRIIVECLLSVTRFFLDYYIFLMGGVGDNFQEQVLLPLVASGIKLIGFNSNEQSFPTPHHPASSISFLFLSCWKRIFEDSHQHYICIISFFKMDLRLENLTTSIFSWSSSILSY